MKRLFHLLGQAVLLAITWAAIFEIGLRMQQYFGPLYDLEMASINLNWESDVVNHQPTPENQNMCIYGDLTGFSYKRSYDANGIRIISSPPRTAMIVAQRTSQRNPQLATATETAATNA